MGRKKTLTIPDEDFSEIELGTQPAPDDPRIFKGKMTAFFDSIIVEYNSGKETPDRLPLDTCPVVDEGVCCFCISYDGDSGDCIA